MNSPRVLHVAEKPSVANELAQIFARSAAGPAAAKRAGPSKYNPIFDIAGHRLRGAVCRSTVTSVTGHLCEIDFGPAHRSWGSCDPSALFDAPIRKAVPPARTEIRLQLEAEARHAAWLVLWLDCDREGENIAFEVLGVCRAANPRIAVFRARFSSLVPAEIARACAALAQPDAHASAAVDTRMELDLRIGAAFTRFQTTRLRSLLGGSDQVVSYGPCQFPTLGFVVERFWDIESFVAEPFWSLRVGVQRGADADEATFIWRRVRLFDRLACLALYEQCLASPEATVLNVVSRQTRKFRPFPLTTVAMQRLAAKKLRMSAERSMQVAERLYQSGFLSYPRTETDKFPREFDFRDAVGQQSHSRAWGAYAASLFGPEHKFRAPKDGKHSDNAHPPIHPTKPADALGGDEARLYELVTRHFLACCSDDAIGHETTVELLIAGEVFHASGLVIQARNFLDVYPYEKWADKTLPVFVENERFVPSAIEMTSGCTTAPKLLSEPELITLMDNNGIGTDATMADHIVKIQERGYVQKIEGDLFCPTPLGVGLVEGYDSISLDSMSRPQIRAEMEADMTKIAAGQRKPEDVVHDAIGRYRQLFMMATAASSLLEDSVRKRWLKHGGSEAAIFAGGDGDGDGGAPPHHFHPPPPPPPAVAPATHVSHNRAHSAPAPAPAPAQVPRGNCFKCGKPGHWASDCPEIGGSGNSRGNFRQPYAASSATSAIVPSRSSGRSRGRSAAGSSSSSAATKRRRGKASPSPRGGKRAPRSKRSSTGRSRSSATSKRAAAAASSDMDDGDFGDDFCGAGDNFGDE